MQANRPMPGTPQDWLNRARSDLALARIPLPAEAFYEDLCFHAQQAAEKALKAVYQQNAWPFRYTHDLDELVVGLRQHGLLIPAGVDAAVVLTSFAWEARYPGASEPVTREEHEEALRHADAVVAWAGDQVAH